MSAVVPLLAALALAPASHGSALSISTHLFAPAAGPLTITAQVSTPAQLGLRLARRDGRAVGWIDPPAPRARILDTWNGTIARRRVRDGAYQVELVAGTRVVDRADFELDGTPAHLLDLRVSSESRPYAGDSQLLATISPNHDDLRDYARVSFRLSEAANVTLNVQRTSGTAETFSTHSWDFDAGPHSVGWVPASTVAARTYVLSLTTKDEAGNTLTYGSPNARVRLHPRAPVVRVMGIDAAMGRQSYEPGQVGALRVSTDEPAISTQVLKAGPDPFVTYADNLLEGVAMTSPSVVDWSKFRNGPRVLPVEIGADWESGLYFVRLVAADGTVGYAPFVVRPAALGQASRVAVILPTNTWQAYNFWDADGDGWGDTWYAGYPNKSVLRNRPYLHRGVPPFFYRYDQGFLHWLYWNHHTVDFLAERDLDTLSGDDLAKAYDLVVYPGHSEYVTTHEYDVVERYRNLGGNLIFLSANNFFWHVAENGQSISRDTKWRDLGRPEASLIGVQYLANDRGEHQGLFQLLDPAPAAWLWEGTGLVEGSTIGAAVGGYGIEIDHTTPQSPAGTIVLAEIPDLFGPGLTAQMAYYETAAGAKVFAAGALDFGGSALTAPVSQMLENLWARLSRP